MRSRTAKPSKPESEVRAYCIPSSWGEWRVSFSDLGLRTFQLPTSHKASKLEKLNGQEGPAGKAVHKALIARLAGKSDELPWDLYDLSGLPVFHIKIWRAMAQIPYGEVRSYKAMAEAAGSPAAFRAAGQACGANPIVLFIPCHRVVASNHLGGFGSGLSWKKKLLNLEGYAC